MILKFQRLFFNIGHVSPCHRFLHVSGSKCSPQVATNVSKEALMELRKRTGYSISKCKQAILQFGDDLAQVRFSFFFRKDGIVKDQSFFRPKNGCKRRLEKKVGTRLVNERMSMRVKDCWA